MINLVCRLRKLRTSVLGNRIKPSLTVQFWWSNVWLISRKWWIFKKLLIHLYQKADTFISIVYKIFLLSYFSMVWWWLQVKGRLLAYISNKETQGDISCNPTSFAHARNPSNIASNSFEFYLLFISGSDLIRLTEKCWAILIEGHVNRLHSE